MAQSRDQTPFLVVGVDPSAGGVAALGQLLAQAPAASGAVYVVLSGGTPDAAQEVADAVAALPGLRLVGSEDAARLAEATEGARAADGLRVSEAAYRTLFDSIDQGFCVFELIDDESGKVVDYRFLEINQVFERQTGLENAVGKLGSAIAPNTEGYWLDAYNRVARTGEPLRLEQYNQSTGRWYRVYASRIGGAGSRTLCTIFDDITERKEAEQRQEFLLELSDLVRSNSDADALLEAMNRLTMEHLGADRCYYCEIDGGVATVRRDARRSGLPSVVGAYPLASMPIFKAVIESERPFVVHNAASTSVLDEELRQLCIALEVISFVDVPVVKNGTPVGILCVAQRTPRNWTDLDVALAVETAERTWVAVERAGAERALRESEERLRVLIEHLPGGAAFIVDRNLRYLLAQGQALREAGKSPHDFLGKTIFEALPAEQAALFEPMYRQALGGQPFVHEHAVDSRAFVTRGIPLRDSSGSIYAVLAVSYDISERKQAEAALRMSEVRFRTLADALPQVIWTNEAGGRASYFNQRWFAYSGLSRDESIGLGWQAIVHPDDAPASVERWKHALAKGTTFDVEYRLRRVDGAYRWHLGRNVPLHDAQGRVISWFGSATDIHDLKVAEAAVRDTVERLRIAIDAAELGTWDWNIQTGDVFWNERHFLLFGMTPTAEPVTPEAFFARVHPDDRARVAEQLQRALDALGVFEAEFRAVCDDGVVRWMSGYGQPVEMQGLTATRMSGVMFDITERKLAEELLQRANEELEARVQARTAELEQLSRTRQRLFQRLVTAQEDERQRIARELHDSLGQYLSALAVALARAQALDSCPPEVQSVLAKLQTITGEIDRELDQLTMELRPPALDDLGLPDAVARYVDEWGMASNVETEVVVTGFDGGRLPSAVEAAAYRIAQEALTNVRKHAQARHVSVILERRPGALRMLIEDNGVGFEAEAVARERSGGRQLGLVGMEERATLAGGTLAVESEPGSGTTIYLQIPLGEERRTR